MRFLFSIYSTHRDREIFGQFFLRLKICCCRCSFECLLLFTRGSNLSRKRFLSSWFFQVNDWNIFDGGLSLKSPWPLLGQKLEVSIICVKISKPPWKWCVLHHVQLCGSQNLCMGQTCSFINCPFGMKSLKLIDFFEYLFILSGLFVRQHFGLVQSILHSNILCKKFWSSNCWIPRHALQVIPLKKTATWIGRTSFLVNTFRTRHVWP